MDTKSIVEITGASKAYPSGNEMMTVLEKTTLSIHRHELLLLMGPSGSGKTTLLSLIGCVIYPTEGHIEILGQIMSSLGEKQLAAIRLKHIGFVFQNYNLIAPLSAIENVMLPLQMQHVPLSQRKDKALKALEVVGMAHRKDNLPKQLSGGEQQRVAIARALVTNPDIILCDEPTGALDKKSAQSVMEQLRRLADEGKSVVVVTHDQRLTRYADRILYLDEGVVSTTPIDIV